jgi:hypothetical protein
MILALTIQPNKVIIKQIDVREALPKAGEGKAMCGRAAHPGRLLCGFGQLAQVLENQTRGFRRLVAFFLFLRVADKRTQLLTVSVRPQVNTSAMASSPSSIRRSRICSSLWKNATCWLWRFFSLSSAWRIGSTSRCAAFTNQLQLAAAAFHLDALCQFNGVAQILVERDFIQRVFTQVYQFRPGVLILRRRV